MPVARSSVALPQLSRPGDEIAGLASVMLFVAAKLHTLPFQNRMRDHSSRYVWFQATHVVRKPTPWPWVVSLLTTG